MRTLAIAALFIVILSAVYIATDPLKTLRWYPEYNADREQINAGVVTLANYDHYAPEERYDALILGNSLSQYCYIDDWRGILGAGSFRAAYHLSSSSQSIFTTNRFLEHAITRGDTLRQILVAFDPYALSDSTAWISEYYDTDPPGLHSGVMKGLLHIYHGSHAMTAGVLKGAAIRALTGRFADDERDYPRWRQNVNYDPRRNEIYWTETEAWLDTADYNSVAQADGRLNHILRRRYHTDKNLLDDNHADVLAEVYRLRDLLDASGAEWRVVIMPNMVGTRLTAHDDSVLHSVFGAGYSNMDTAANAERSDPRAFLDPGHPRPAVMRKIMREAYRN